LDQKAECREAYLRGLHKIMNTGRDLDRQVDEQFQHLADRLRTKQRSTRALNTFKS
jgi:hypothetical protein